MNLIKSFWKGERQLWQAFWLLFILGYLALLVITASIYIALKDILSYRILDVINLVLNVPFLIYASIATWRCSKNTKWTIWTWLARCIIILIILRNAYGVYVLFTMNTTRF